MRAMTNQWCVKNEQGTAHERLPLFVTGQTIRGRCTSRRCREEGGTPRRARRVDWADQQYGDRSTTDFLALARDLDPPGELSSPKSMPFEFKHVEMQYESYHGINVRLRYFLRVTVVDRIASNVTQGLNTGCKPGARAAGDEQLDQNGGWDRGLSAHRV